MKRPSPWLALYTVATLACAFHVPVSHGAEAERGRLEKDPDYAPPSSKAGECTNSSHAAGDVCGTTKTFMDVSKVVTAGGEAAGAIVQQVQTNKSNAAAFQQSLQPGGASQAYLMDAAAKSMRQAARVNMVIGATNAVMGAMVFTRVGVHSGLQTQFSNAASGARKQVQGGSVDEQGNVELQAGSNQLGYKTFEKTDLNSKYTYSVDNPANAAQLGEQKKKKLGIALEQVLDDASKEQKQMKEQATATGVAALVKGLQKGLEGYFGLKSANDLAKAADALKKTTTTTTTPPDLGGDPLAENPNGAESARTGATIDPNADAVTAAADQPEDPGDGADLGTGFDPNGDDRAAEATPTPSPFVPGGNAQGGQAAAMPGFAGGAGTKEASNDPSAQKGAEYAGLGGKSESYVGAGGVPTTGRGIASGRDGAGGPDLSQLAELFKQQQEQLDSHKDILSADKMKGRQIAGVLGKEANLFERISNVYSEKARKGEIGL